MFIVALLTKISIILKIALSLGFISFAVFLYGYFFEKNNIVIEKVKINRTPLGNELSDLKMIQFSDLHFKKIGIREKKLRKIINEIKPDIIFFTGDFFNSKSELNDSIIFNHGLKYLSSLSFTKYFFFVLGEDEYYYRDYLKKRLGDIKIRVLDNEINSLAMDSIRLNIIGITNDTKNFDTFYKNDKSHRNNINRFNEFMKQPILKKYQNYIFYIAGQYTMKWENYEISSEVELPSENSSFGISFYSQLPMGINKSYFLELNPDSRIICVNSNGESDLKGKICSDVIIRNSKFYQIKINIKNVSRSTRIRTKIWDSKEEEPDLWQIDCSDSGKNRSTMGTIGLLRSNGNTFWRFRNLRVRMLDYNQNSTMFYEGVKEIPYDLNTNGFIQDEWLGLSDIKNVLENSQKTNKPYLLEKKIDKMAEEKKLDGFNIALTHSPSNIRILENKGVDLVLSGHTHGGQIDIPFIDRFIHDSYRGQLLKGGLKKFPGTQLYINRGIGTSIIPIRINCLPEVTLFKFSNN